MASVYFVLGCFFGLILGAIIIFFAIELYNAVELNNDEEE